MRDSAPIPTLCAVLSAMLLAACWTEEPWAGDAELRRGPFSGADAPLSPLAQRAVGATAAFDATPEDPEASQALLDIYAEIYRTKWPILATPTNRVYAEVEARVYDRAEAGDRAFLEALMVASFGPYGQSAEGSEGYADMLWALFERAPLRTLEVLERIGEERRERLMQKFYTRPPHAYDFVSIGQVLRTEWPQKASAEVQRILAAIGEGPVSDSDVSPLARELREALLVFDEDPGNTEARETALRAFDLMYGSAGWERSPESARFSRETTGRMQRLAELGDPAFLRALMRAGDGPYGQTTAGAEKIQEGLWTLLSRRPQQTLDVLAGLSGRQRQWLVDFVYTRPARDGLDFVLLEDELGNVTVPAGLEQEVKRIRRAVETLAYGVAPAKAREHVELALAAAARGPAGYEDAVREYESAVALGPGWAYLHEQLGLLHMTNGHVPEALTSFETYLAMDPPDHPRNLNQLRLLIETLKEEQERPASADPY